MDHLPHDEKLFNEYHALIVHVAKTLCKKTPKCGICPLKSIEHSAAEPQPKVPRVPKVS